MSNLMTNPPIIYHNTSKNSFGLLLVSFCDEYQDNLVRLSCETSQHQHVNPNNTQYQGLCSGHSKGDLMR